MDMTLVIVIVVIVIVIAIIFISNKLNQATIKIEEAESGIDVTLTKRYDTLNKILKVVKNYKEHETVILTKLGELRKDMTLNEKAQVNGAMNKLEREINILAENYPLLQSNENYKQLQMAIYDVEEHLQAARRLYNSNVSIFNQMLVTFPISLIAKFKGLKRKDFFEAETEKKEDIEINL